MPHSVSGTRKKPPPGHPSRDCVDTSRDPQACSGGSPVQGMYRLAGPDLVPERQSRAWGLSGRP